MALYTVVEPCVVGELHYARPTDHPIEVDDAVALPLVESGALAPAQPVDAHPQKPHRRRSHEEPVPGDVPAEPREEPREG